MHTSLCLRLIFSKVAPRHSSLNLLAGAIASLTCAPAFAEALTRSSSVQRWTVVSSAETSDEELSTSLSDRRRAARSLPLELDVQVVKSLRGGRDLQVIGVLESDVWVVDLDRKVAQVRKIGKVFVPDPILLERIARSLAGARVVLAFRDADHGNGLGAAQPLPNGSEHDVSHSAVAANPTVLVTADESLYRIKLDAAMEPAVQRLGALKKQYIAP